MLEVAIISTTSLFVVLTWFLSYRLSALRTIALLKNEVQKYREHLEKKEELVNDFTDRFIKSNENLERLLIERTQLLEQHSGRLNELAYRNAHLVRSQIARLLGLSSLINIATTPQEQLQIAKLIYHESTELDLLLRNLNATLARLHLNPSSERIGKKPYILNLKNHD